MPPHHSSREEGRNTDAKKERERNWKQMKHTHTQATGFSLMSVVWLRERFRRVYYKLFMWHYVYIVNAALWLYIGLNEGGMWLRR